MNEPKRWLEDGDAPNEVAALLRSLPVPTRPTSDKQAELAQQLSALALSKAGPVAGSSAGWIKLGLVGVVCLIAGAAFYWGTSSAEPDPQPRPPVVVPNVAIASAEAPSSAAPSSAIEVKNAPVLAPRPPSAAPSLKAPSRDTLAEEELLLESARRAAASSPAAAWAFLQQHQRKFPNGQLSAERAFLSVDVLRRLGKHAAADREAERLIARFPNSTYAARLRAKQGSK
jgi:hypothetical protein